MPQTLASIASAQTVSQAIELARKPLDELGNSSSCDETGPYQQRRLPLAASACEFARVCRLSRGPPPTISSLRHCPLPAASAASPVLRVPSPAWSAARRVPVPPCPDCRPTPTPICTIGEHLEEERAIQNRTSHASGGRPHRPEQRGRDIEWPDGIPRSPDARERLDIIAPGFGRRIPRPDGPPPIDPARAAVWKPDHRRSRLVRPFASPSRSICLSTMPTTIPVAVCHRKRIGILRRELHELAQRLLLTLRTSCAVQP